MSTEICYQVKSFVACLTEKWALTSMYYLMCMEMSCSLKSFVTYLTEKWAFTSMYQFMYTEISCPIISLDGCCDTIGDPEGSPLWSVLYVDYVVQEVPAEAPTLLTLAGWLAIIYELRLLLLRLFLSVCESLRVRVQTQAPSCECFNDGFVLI